MLSASVQQWPHEHMVTNGLGNAAGPWLIERALRAVKDSGDVDLPDEFTFHDLRHYLASLLIAAGAGESTRSASDAVITKRVDSSKDAADAVWTEG